MKNKEINNHLKSIIFKNGELIDLRTEEDIKIDNEMFMNIKKPGMCRVRR